MFKLAIAKLAFNYLASVEWVIYQLSKNPIKLTAGFLVHFLKKTLLVFKVVFSYYNLQLNNLIFIELVKINIENFNNLLHVILIKYYNWWNFYFSLRYFTTIVSLFNFSY